MKSMVAARLIYWMLFILTTAFAFFFFGLLFLGAASMISESPDPLDECQVLIRHGLYGLAVSLFFALLLLLINVGFRMKFSFGYAYILRFFFIHFLILVSVFAIVYLLIY